MNNSAACPGSFKSRNFWLKNKSFNYAPNIVNFLFLIKKNQQSLGLPWSCSGYEFTCQYKRHGFNPRSVKSPHAAEQLSPWPTVAEPECCSYWGPCALSLCSARREAAAVRSASPTTKSSLCSSQLEKAHTQQQRLRATKNKQIKIKKIIITNNCS